MCYDTALLAKLVFVPRRAVKEPPVDVNIPREIYIIPFK